MSKSFVNLHTHSFYSILRAVGSPHAVLARAKELNCPAVALTDTGVGYGLVDFYEQAETLGDIKPILGAELFVSPDSRFERRAGIDGKEGSIVLLAQNKKGYQNLVTLVSLAHLEGFYYKPRIDFELLAQYAEGLICLTGGHRGMIGLALEQTGKKKAEEYLERYLKIFGTDRFYAELVARDMPVQKRVNKFFLEQTEKQAISVVVTSDAHFLHPEDEESAETLFCIGKNFQINDPNYQKFAKGNSFRSWEEMTEILDYVDEKVLEKARKKSLEIAESVDMKLKFNQKLLPEFEVPEGETEASLLQKHCEEGFSERYSHVTKEEEIELRERLGYELGIITKMGFDAYFLIVEDFIRFARENGIAVGPGRGSAAGSIVSYLLKITNIDPIKYELLFERFLNPERISMPDIDIDFSDERRDEVVQYVVEKYGAERVSRVCTFGTLSAKAALKDVGRVHGIPFAEMNAMTKMLPNRPGLTLDDTEKISDFKTLIDTKKELKKVFDVAKRLEGSVRHVSVHACAVIIGREELTKHTPIQWAPGANDNVKITQYPYQQLEHLGLLKMDFLGLKNLSILEKAIANIKVTRGEEIDLTHIPTDDKKTFQMMARGETTGVFQFESAGMRRYLRELRPTEFEDLVAMNALYRPGPMEYIPTYIKGKHEPKSVKYIHKVLEPILAKTYGIAVYQEQVLKIAQVFAGFTLGEADILRKAIGKKIAHILSKQRKRFIEGATERGYEKKLAEKIFDDIVVPFSGYGFNRSHAVCYARIAYETAYLRANYPVEFMAAMMTTDRNNTDRIVLEMNECTTMKIDVLPPSINESGAYFTVVGGGDPNQSSLEKESEGEKKIRFGLTAIKGLGEETVNQIMRERKADGKFIALQDFARRVPAKLMNKKTLEALAFSGAFDEFGDRKAIVDSLDELAQFAKEVQGKASSGQMGLFGGTDESSIEFALKNTQATKEDILAWERESLGLFVSDHPLKEVAEALGKYGTLIGDLTETDDAGQKRTLHGIITEVRRLITRRGQHMAIAKLEDMTGKIELAIFPQIYEAIPQHVLQVDQFVRVRGKVDEREGVLNMIVDDIKLKDLKRLSEVVEDEPRGIDTVKPPEESEEEVKKKRQELPAATTAAAEGFFEINIPAGTRKSVVTELKNLILSRKKDVGRNIYIHIDGQKIEIPFLVQVDEEFQNEIRKMLL